MRDTVLRQLEMLRRIPRYPHKIDAASLVNLFEQEGVSVTIRTVQRDLDKLSKLFPLVSDESSKPYGWSWKRDHVTDLPGMDFQMALTFTLANKYLRSLLPRSSLNHLQPHFTQAERVMDELSESGIGDWPSKVRVLPRGLKLLHPAVDTTVLDVLYEAILRNKRVTGEYHPRNAAEPKEYVISPLGIVLRDGVTYVVGTLREYDDIIQLVAHRFIKAELTDTPVTPPKGFDLDSYIRDGGFGYSLEGKPVRLKAVFDRLVAKHLGETPLSEDQSIVETPDGSICVEATVMDTLELRWWLLGFGAQVEVIKPARIRNAFRDIFTELAAKYA